ncbi:MAG: TIGR00730 family Rossman fold protein [Mizugakiibacter sp.]|uniref:LOG family protein n=1 Tax=Mizugakiibacter sp. TaxID=1972610 RepID=UPI0031C607D5|nr:TIGR00730 family Rossman fold protein [Xanthomonadaceae bacterium]
MTDRSQHEALRRNIMQGSAYRLAQEDAEFLADDDLRAVRLQLELLKPEHALRQHNIRSTVVVFGSARLAPPEHARARLAAVEARARMQPDDPELAHELDVARRRLAQSRYYDEAQLFARIVSRRFQSEGRRDFVVVTGGGPGIMEAANRGAYEMGARSIGFNITLPREQQPKPFITPELAFRFHYFALRKMHFLQRAKALVAFPGGYGALDELFEALTLVQTRKMARIPIVLVGGAFWRRAVDFDFLVDEGVIGAADAKLFAIVESAGEAVTALQDFYAGAPPP